MRRTPGSSATFCRSACATSTETTRPTTAYPPTASSTGDAPARLSAISSVGEMRSSNRTAARTIACSGWSSCGEISAVEIKSRSSTGLIQPLNARARKGARCGLMNRVIVGDRGLGELLDLQVLLDHRLLALLQLDHGSLGVGLGAAGVDDRFVALHEDLDLRLVLPLLERLADGGVALAGLERALDLLLDLGVRLLPRRLVLGLLDDVKAELRLDDAGDLAVLQLPGHVLERFDHAA